MCVEMSTYCVNGYINICVTCYISGCVNGYVNGCVNIYFAVDRDLEGVETLHQGSTEGSPAYRQPLQTPARDRSC